MSDGKKIHEQGQRDPVNVVIPPKGYGNLGKAIENYGDPECFEAGVKEEHDGDYPQLNDIPMGGPDKPGY